MVIRRPLWFVVTVLVATAGGVSACSDESPDATSPASSGSPPSFTLRDEAATRGVVALNHCGHPTQKRYMLESIGQGCALFDKEGDGDLDLYLVDACGLVPPPTGASATADWSCDTSGRCVLLENDGHGYFTDVTAASGAGLSLFGSGVVAGDYDGDSDLDLYVTAWGPNRLLQNDGAGRFRDVTEAAGVGDAAWSSAALFFDADGDDDLDLYVGNYFAMTLARDPDCWNKIDCPYFEMRASCGPKGMVAEPDTFYVNQGDGTFREASAAAGLRAVEPRYALGAVAFDYDLDGDQDLYVANDSRGNYLFVNDGHGHFSEEADLAGCALSAGGLQQAGMGVGCGDFDGDLDLDLFVTNFAHDDNTLYQNDGLGGFLDVTTRHSWGTESWFALGWGTGFVDLDLDGDLDLFVANGHVFPEADQRAPELTYRQLCRAYELDVDGRYRDVTAGAFPGTPRKASFRGAAFGDVDQDGDIDVAVVALNEAPSLFINAVIDAAAPRRHFLAVDLEQPGRNRFAIGARLIADVGGRRLLRVVQAGGSFDSMNALTLHFGLGTASQIEQLQVTWPDGTTEVAHNLAADQRVHWRRGTPPERRSP